MRALAVGTLVALVAAGVPARAAPIVSLKADGLTYTLTGFTTSSPLTDDFTLMISGINGTTDTEGMRTGVNAIAFTQPANFASAAMTSPAGYTFIDGGLNSSGCDSNGNFLCFDNTAIPPTPTTPYPANSSLSFAFSETLSSGTFANYTPDLKIEWVGLKSGNYDLVSEGITVNNGGPVSPPPPPPPPPVLPEPAGLAVFGVALAGLGILRRRHR